MLKPTLERSNSVESVANAVPTTRSVWPRISLVVNALLLLAVTTMALSKAHNSAPPSPLSPLHQSHALQERWLDRQASGIHNSTSAAILFMSTKHSMETRLDRVWRKWAAPCGDRIGFSFMKHKENHLRFNKRMVEIMLDLAHDAATGKAGFRPVDWLHYASDSCVPVDSCHAFLGSLSQSNASFLTTPKASQWSTLRSVDLLAHEDALREYLLACPPGVHKSSCAPSSCKRHDCRVGAPDEWVISGFWELRGLSRTGFTLVHAHFPAGHGHPTTYQCAASNSSHTDGWLKTSVSKVHNSKPEMHFMRKIPTSCLPVVESETKGWTI